MIGVFWGAACAMYYISTASTCSASSESCSSGCRRSSRWASPPARCSSRRSSRDPAYTSDHPRRRVARPILRLCGRCCRGARCAPARAAVHPAFLRVLAARSRPTGSAGAVWALFGLPSPSRCRAITFRPGTSPAAAQFLRRHPSYGAGLLARRATGGWPGRARGVGRLPATCADARHGDSCTRSRTAHSGCGRRRSRSSAPLAPSHSSCC